MIKEYENFVEFYNDGFKYAQKIKQMNASATTIKQIEYSRKYLKSNILNSYFKIGVLSNEQAELLKTNNKNVKFSIDSMVKNILKHPEIKLEEYLFISKIINLPDKVSLSKNNDNSILIFKYNNRYYQIVIKTTNCKSENYLTSFIRSNEKEFNRY